jgi:hypothetical protein
VADVPVTVSYYNCKFLAATQEIYAPGGNSVFLGDRRGSNLSVRDSVFVVDHIRQAIFVLDRQRGEDQILMGYKNKLHRRQRYWEYVSAHPSHLTEATFPESILKEARDEAFSYVRWCLLSTASFASSLMPW